MLSKAYRARGLQLGRSRNKVAVGEPAAGSPPRRTSQGRPGGAQAPPTFLFHQHSIRSHELVCLHSLVNIVSGKAKKVSNSHVLAPV